MLELGIEGVKPSKVIRVGYEGRYARKALAIFNSTDEVERILSSAEQIKLTNDIFLTRDRTYNQREEARLYRLEKEKEEKDGALAQRGRGRGRGRPPGRNSGSVRGRGARGKTQTRKRQRSGDDDATKRMRMSTSVDDNAEESSVRAPPKTPPQLAEGQRERPATPHSTQQPQQSLTVSQGEHNF